MIQLTDVSKTYGDAIVVRDVTLAIAKGGLTSIIGPNGAGKSTLLGIMSRLLGASAGTVTVDGLDISKTSSDALAQRLSILRQENHVVARLTVREIVEFGRFPYSKGRLSAADRAQVERALAFMELLNIADRFLDELSGGQRQRAFIAMVLCQDTDYVLLDEPLNNLDIKHSTAIMRRLRAIADELRKTIVVVLHDLNFASSYSDRMIAMRDGQVARQGSPQEIMRADVLSSLYDVEVEVQLYKGMYLAHYYRRADDDGRVSDIDRSGSHDR